MDGFFLFFLICLSLVYAEATEFYSFCMLLLCSRYWSVLRLFLIVFMYRTILFANRTSLTSSFPIFILFILTYCTMTSSLTLNKSEKVDTIVSYLYQMVYFLPLSIVLAIGLSCDLLCWGMILLFLAFIMKGWILSLFSGSVDGHVICVNLLLWFIAFVDFCT